MFAVTIASELYGDTIGVGRGIDELGLLVDMCYVPPKDTVVRVVFVNYDEPRASMTATASSCGMVGESVLLRFIAFDDTIPAVNA